MENIKTGLTIQEVAEQTGLSVHTLRYYERIGLLNPVNRATNGHRRYSEDDISRIRFFTRLRATGMPIRQMQEYAALVRQGDNSTVARLTLLQAHRKAVEAQICELQQDLTLIDKKIELYKEKHENEKPGS